MSSRNMVPLTIKKVVSKDFPRRRNSCPLGDSVHCAQLECTAVVEEVEDTATFPALPGARFYQSCFDFSAGYRALTRGYCAATRRGL
jgi:hypothetical protein